LGRLGRVERTFLAVAVLFALLYFTGTALPFQFVLAVAGFFLGIAVTIRLARYACAI